MSNNDDPGSYENDLHTAALEAYREVAGRVTEPEPQPQAVERQEVQAETDTASQTEAREKAATEGRDERGRFAAKAPKTDGKLGETPSAEEAPAEADPAPAEPTEPVTAASPPPSWSVKAKTAWDKVPPEVQAEIAKRETEMGQGLAALRDFKDLKPYADMAAQQGTTISRALDHYISIDNLMKRDMAGGLAMCAESYGMDQQQIGQMFLNLAQRYGASAAAPAATSYAPTNGHAAAIDENDLLMEVLQPVLAPILAQLNELKSTHSKELTELKSYHSTRVEADRNASVQSLAQEITKFAADPKNIYFHNVEADVARLFEKGMVPLTGNHRADLQTAYDLAVRMHPEIYQALIEKRLSADRDAARQREQEAADKARNASRSLGGSRVPGTVVKSQIASDSDDVEAAVRQAWRQHSLA